MARNPLSFTSRTYATILAELELRYPNRPAELKEMLAGLFDILHWYNDARAQNFTLESALTEEAVDAWCRQLDYYRAGKAAAFIDLLVELKEATVFPYTVTKENLTSSVQTSAGDTVVFEALDSLLVPVGSTLSAPVVPGDATVSVVSAANYKANDVIAVTGSSIATIPDLTVWSDYGASITLGGSPMGEWYMAPSWTTSDKQTAYFFGGILSGAGFTKILKVLASDPSNFIDTGKTLPAVIYGGSIVDHLGNLLFIGSGGGNSMRTVGGDPETWETIPGSLDESSSFIWMGRLFEIGGWAGYSTSGVYVVNLTPSISRAYYGDCGFPINITSNVVVQGNYAYFVGGWNWGDYNDVFRVTLLNTGEIQLPIEKIGVLPFYCQRGKLVVPGDGKIYLTSYGINGAISSRTLAYADLTDMTAWYSLTDVLPLPQLYGIQYRLGDRLYLTGGQAGNHLMMSGTKNQAISGGNAFKTRITGIATNTLSIAPPVTLGFNASAGAQVRILGRSHPFIEGTTMVDQLIGVSDGVTPRQEFLIDSVGAILADDAVVTIGGTPYTRKFTLVNSSPTDAHYTVIYRDNRPVLVVGDDEHGKLPAAGDVVGSYRLASGRIGNVPKLGSTANYTGADSAVNTLTILADAKGGAEAESLERARYMAPKMLRAQNRAVTEEDYETMALNYSTGIIMAKSLPGFYGAGSVGLHVIPAGGGSMPFAQMMDLQNFLIRRSVMKYADIRVRPPLYQAQGITAGIKMRPGKSFVNEQKFAILAALLCVTEKTKELFDIYEAEGITGVIAYANLIWGALIAPAVFTVADQETLLEILRIRKRDGINTWGKQLYANDVVGAIKSVPSIERTDVTLPTALVSVAISRILTEGTINITEIT